MSRVRGEVSSTQEPSSEGDAVGSRGNGLGTALSREAHSQAQLEPLQRYRGLQEAAGQSVGPPAEVLGDPRRDGECGVLRALDDRWG